MIAPHLVDEIETVILGPMTDERKPLGRCPRPMNDPDEEEEEEPMPLSMQDAVLDALREGGMMSTTAIASALDRDEDDAERALVVLRLAGNVQKQHLRERAMWRIAA